ncbi:aquaporin-like protein [Choiromyces venosus 120613-1]|uniref:Aquaporin-like protein n=1 Tax=Choiromyces venosus 120613-1 TaxID=1336337 RepID=A0A3N4JNK0_9PEZI|nr:aquaporin-like protein [Choiromyces venosus 120613-1]
MAGPKISTTASSSPIKGVDSDNASLNVGSRATSKKNAFKNYALAMFGEFLGTFLFLFFAFGGTQAAKINHNGSGSFPKDPTRAVPTPELLLYVSFCFGFALTVNVWVFYRVTGALFNPAITLGCILTGGVPPLKGALMGIAQLVGGIVASGLVEVLTPGKLAVGTSLAPDVSVVQGLFIEVFLTAQLMITIFLLAVEKHRATFIAPLGIGLSFFITQLFGIYFTGGSLNPARSLGPAIITRDFPSYHWIYWVGPALGAALGALVYKILLFVNYKTLNPGQDDDGLGIVRCEIDRKGKFKETQNEGQEISGPSETTPRPADENV